MNAFDRLREGLSHYQSQACATDEGDPDCPQCDAQDAFAVVRAAIQAAERANEALSEIAVALITVQGQLGTPYHDAPQWTPWTRFVERAFNEVADAREELRVALAAVRDTP